MQSDKRQDIPASEALHGVVRDNNADQISLFEVKKALHERGFGLIMLIFSLPLCLPLPLPPGATALPSIPLLLFSLQMLMGRDSPWVPKWLGKKSIKRQTLANIIEKGAPYLQKIERFLRHRFSFTSSMCGERLEGFFCLVFSLSIAVPLPLTNFIPATGIAIMSLGLLSKDGITVIAGMIVGSCGVTLTTVLLIFGKKALEGLFSFVGF